MDSLSTSCSDSRSYQSSFGLLDEHLIQDLSLGNESNLRIKEKPPMPIKRRVETTAKVNDNDQRMVKGSFNKQKEGNPDSEADSIDKNVENGEMTVHSIHLNQSDLNQLEDEFTFDGEDDDLSTNNSLNKTSNMFKNNEEDSNRNNFIRLNKNAGVLSGEEPDRFSANSKTSNIQKYSNLSHENLFEPTSANSTQQNSNLSETSYNDSAKTNANRMSNLFAERLNSQNSLSNVTIDNDMSSIERINQLVMESVERVKRKGGVMSTSITSQNDNFLNFNIIKSKNSDKLIDIEANGRISSNSRAFYHNTSNFSNELSNDLNCFNVNFKQQEKSGNISFNNNAANTSFQLESPALLSKFKSSNFYEKSSKLELNESELNSKPSQQDSTNDSKRQSEIASIYFKPSSQSQLNITNNNNNMENETFSFKNGNFPGDTQSGLSTSLMFDGAQNLIKDYFNEINDNMFQLGSGGIGVGFNQTINESNQFQSGEEIMALLEQHEIENKKEFADNELSVMASNESKSDEAETTTDSETNKKNEKWWNNKKIFQTSKLELSNFSYLSNNDTIQQVDTISALKRNESIDKKSTKIKIAVGDYFTRKSEMPQFLADKDAGVNLTSQFTTETTTTTTTTAKAIKSKSDESNRNPNASFKYPNNSNNNNETLSDKTICELNDHNASRREYADYDNSNNESRHNNQNKIEGNESEGNFTLSTTNTMISGVSSNFSFTLNSSETGEFIQKKMFSSPPNKQSSINSLNVSTTISSNYEEKTKTKIPIQKQTRLTASNLKMIGEELERVSSRLAVANETNNNIESTVSIASVSSEVKHGDLAGLSSKSDSQSLRVLMNIDETLSSISSSDITTNINQPNKNDQPTKPISGGVGDSKQNSSICSNQKAKIPSGSLTSTPSKNKSENNSADKPSKKNSQTTDLSRSSNNNLFNQESFVSSIPDQLGNSTLLMNRHHHHQHHQSSHHNSQSKSKISKLKKPKNAEIQTSPERTTTSSTSTSTSSSSIGTAATAASASRLATVTSTTTLSTSSTLDAAQKLINQNESDENKTSNRISTSSLSASDLVNNALASHVTNINNFAASLLSNTAAGGMSNLNNGTGSGRASIESMTSNGTNLIPVAFLPISAFLPCMQKLYDEFQSSQKSQIETNLTNHSVSSQFGSMIPKHFQNSSDLTNANQATTTIFSNSNPSTKFELPQLEINRESIDFGIIAEGCRDTCRLFIKINNLNMFNLGQSKSNTSYPCLQIELDDYSDWTFEEFKCDPPKSNSDQQKNSPPPEEKSLIRKRISKFDSLRRDFSKTISLHMNKSSIKQSYDSTSSSTECETMDSDSSCFNNNQLNFDLITNYYEFFVHLNTKNLNYFKDLLYQQQISGKKAENANDTNLLNPVLVKTNLSIYCCFNNSAPTDQTSSSSSFKLNKYLLDRLDLKYVLGYARLKTSASIDTVEFEIDEIDKSNSKDAANQEEMNQSLESTITSDTNSKSTVEKLIPLSNAGNISIDVNCFFTNEKNDAEFFQMQYLNFRNYELRLVDSVVNLEANCQKKHFAHLVLLKTDRDCKTNCSENLENLNMKLIVEVKPNGFRYELPIYVKPKPKYVKPIENKLTTSIAGGVVGGGKTIVENNPKKSNTSLKLASSKSIVFFGKALRNSKFSKSIENDLENVGGLINDFVLMSSNEFKFECQINLITYSIDSINQKNENDSSSSSSSSIRKLNKTQIGLFKFANEMKSLSNTTSVQDSMSKLQVEMEPKKNVNIKLTFNTNLIDSNTNSNQIFYGAVQISSANYDQRFSIFLVGFLSECYLDIENVLKLNESNKAINESDLRRQLYSNNIKPLWYSFEFINQNQSAVQSKSRGFDQKVNIYKNTFKLTNKSSNNSKCVIYPIVYDLKNDCKLILATNEPNNKKKSFRFYLDNEISYGRFVIYVDMPQQNPIYQQDDLIWLELKTNNDQLLIHVEIELPSSKVNMNENKRIIENFVLGLFWIEYEINAYCIKAYQQLNISNETITKHRKFQHESEENFVDTFLHKIITNKSLTRNGSYDLPVNLSTRSSSVCNLNDLSSINKNLINNNNNNNSLLSSSLSEDQSCLFNNSIISTKAKVNQDDFIRLLRQSLKCSIINILVPFKQDQLSIDDSYNSNIIMSSDDCFTKHDQITYFENMNSQKVKEQFLKNNENLKRSKESLQFNEKNEAILSNDKNNIQLLDFTLNESSEDNLTDSRSLIQEQQTNSEIVICSNNKLVNEPWSIDPDVIIINNISNESSLHNHKMKTTLNNNLSHKSLPFDVIYRSYLDVEPSNGILDPLGSIDLIITPRRETINKLPWFGIISVVCNKTQKDIRISLNPLVTNCVTSLSSDKDSSVNLNLPPPLPPASSKLSNKNYLAPQASQIKRSNKTNLNNTSTMLNSLIPIASASTPLSAASSVMTTDSATLEQGTLISEITQHSLDSLSLTPLISASFLIPFDSYSSTSINSKQDLQDSYKLENSKGLSKTLSSKNLVNGNDKSIIKIAHFGKYAQIRFPPVCITHRKSYDLTLINPTNCYVNWKAYSTVPAFIRTQKQEPQVLTKNLQQENTNLKKSSYSVFMLNPNTGIIPPSQKQTIKIEFNPREAYGVFTQYWEIDTRTDFHDISTGGSTSMPLSYNCKLVISGTSIPLENQFSTDHLSEEEDYHLRLSNRILKNKSNILNEPAARNASEILPKEIGNGVSSSELHKNQDTKENLGSTLNTILSEKSLASSYLNPPISNSSSNGTIGASSFHLSTSSLSCTTKRVILKDEELKFPDTIQNKTSKVYLTIHNREERSYNVAILQLMDPFYCKHTKININSKHYIKVPIEFRPRVVGEYVEKVLIRVDTYDSPLTCIIKATCIPNK